MHAPYRVEVVDHVYDEEGELAIQINEGDCIVRIGRGADLATVAREMMMLGVKIGCAGLAVVPVLSGGS